MPGNIHVFAFRLTAEVFWKLVRLPILLIVISETRTKKTVQKRSDSLFYWVVIFYK